LHATFRRSGRSDAEQGFDIDFYDLHWLPRQLALTNDAVWRTDLFGGGRVLALVDRFKNYRTLGEYAQSKGWDYGEGFIEGNGKLGEVDYITGKKYLPSEGLTEDGPDRNKIRIAEAQHFEVPRPETRYTPPMLLVREHMGLAHGLWTDSYLTYGQQIVGFCAPKDELKNLRALDEWLTRMKPTLQAHLALTSPRLYVQKATALQASDVYSIVYPEDGNLDLSVNEAILVDDIVDYYGDFIRLGEDSKAMNERGSASLPAFNDVYTRQVNTIYRKKPLRALAPQTWPGIVCQPFVFGEGNVDWDGAASLKGKLNMLLKDRQGTALEVTRIARIYDGNFIFLLKPDHLRFWLRSVALRDADETLADLRAQGL
jgi:hypothetical protein